jgi:hypothetical protein
MCRGLKTYAPLGGIIIKCIMCDGIGFIESDAPQLPILNPFDNTHVWTTNDDQILKKKKKKRRKNTNPILDTLITRVDNATTV